MSTSESLEPVAVFHCMANGLIRMIKLRISRWGGHPGVPEWAQCRHRVFIKRRQRALTGVVQWVGHHPEKQKVAGLIPDQGTCLGSVPDLRLGHVQEGTDQCFSLSLSPSLPFSLKINKILKEKKGGRGLRARVRVVEAEPCWRGEGQEPRAVEDLYM